MNAWQWHAVTHMAALLALLPNAQAQQQRSGPRIGYVFPAGGQRGATFEVVIGGQFLEGVTNAYVSGTGVQATVLEHYRPLTPKEANDLRTKLQELQDKRAAADKVSAKDGSQTSTNRASIVEWTPADQKLIADIRTKLATFQRRPLNPAIAETVTLQIKLSSETDLGEREIRLGTNLGLSNPLLFCVGQLTEFSDPPAGGIKETKPSKESAVHTPKSETTINLPVTVNGQILPGGVNRYRFKATKGQRLVIAASARELIPYLPDAVPGWFQATMTLSDAEGHELEYADHYRFRPDPVLYSVIPKDGDYVLEIHDSIYRGREDFVYRITLGELPFVVSIFPLGCKADSEITVAVRGANLPVTRLAMETKGKAPGVYPVTVGKGDRIYNSALFAVDTLPECLEKEPNDQLESAQPVTLPIIVNGRIDPPGEWDVFRFEGRAGQQIVAEVLARRLNSPLDSVLRLTDATGKQLAFNDDHEDKGTGLVTHHADSYLTATLPADGAYILHLSDTQHKGGPDFAYRLRISAPRPDFDLRVVPSSISARVGGTVPITVYALRRDGFTNQIAIALKDAPEGFKLSGGAVLVNQEQARLTLTVPSLPTTDPVNLNFEGRAQVQDQEIVHRAVPAEDMMQAFAYRHLVPAKELKVSVAGRGMAKATPKILSQTPVKIPAGGTVRVRVSVPTATSVANVKLELSDPPDGVVIKNVAPTLEGAEIVLQSDAAKVTPGLKGNLIIKIFAQRAGSPANEKPSSTKQRVPLGTLPAIPFEIVQQ